MNRHGLNHDQRHFNTTNTDHFGAKARTTTQQAIEEFKHVSENPAGDRNVKRTQGIKKISGLTGEVDNTRK